MNRFGPVVFVLLSAALSGPMQDAAAQAVEIHRVAMSPRMLGTYPADEFPVSTGLRVVPLHMYVYLKAEMEGGVSTASWTMEAQPAGSAAAFDDPAAVSVKFKPDVAGQYIVKLFINDSTTAYDTLLAATYVGLPSTGMNCGTCHSAKTAEWRKTKHANIFDRGISGQLNVTEYEGKVVGSYREACIKCHTTGWDQKADNGNYGWSAKQSGFDTTWRLGYPLVNGAYMIPFADSSQVINMYTNFPAVAAVANVGCESCHGPGSAHLAAPGKRTIGANYEAGSCMQCHDAPAKHRLGSYWAASSHATMPLSGEEASRSGCWPCHNGMAMAKFAMNPASPDYSDVEPVESISCVSCHDPHSDANPFQLRIVKRDKLANGYVVPDQLGGNGQLCMNCHRARENTKDRVIAQLRVFRDRFYPHYSPQADMYLGANGYEYDLPITGLGSHHGLDGGCVTCHMYERVDGTSKHSNHQMNLIDEQGNDVVTPCRTCHGSQLTKFDDIKAAADFDGNGTVEGVQTEIKGMLNTLKALLPKNAQGEPVNMAAEFRLDSMAVKANPEFYPAIMNYYFVKYDHSYGIHNTKYAVALLQASLARLITGVDLEDQRIPNTFSLGQNYPNPFNPSTKISFSVARTSSVFIGVYNSTGELVATLTDGTLTPGNYTTSWNGAGLPSGTYFCRMTAVGNGSQAFNTTKKMMLVK